MKHINKSLWKLAAVCGVIVDRRNWFFMLVIPAIPGQGHCLGIMVGTHGRRGLILGNRWFFTT